MDLAKRYHVLLIVHFANFRFNTISTANVANHFRGLIDMQPHLLTISLPDHLVRTFNAQHFALDGVDAPQCDFITCQEIRVLRLSDQHKGQDSFVPARNWTDLNTAQHYTTWYR